MAVAKERDKKGKEDYRTKEEERWWVVVVGYKSNACFSILQSPFPRTCSLMYITSVPLFYLINSGAVPLFNTLDIIAVPLFSHSLNSNQNSCQVQTQLQLRWDE